MWYLKTRNHSVQFLADIMIILNIALQRLAMLCEGALSRLVFVHRAAFQLFVEVRCYPHQ